jgi:adenylosuccinate synthase
MPGWMTDISKIKNYRDLPQRAKDYLGRLEALIGCPIGLVSVGPAREQSIFKSPMVE